MLTLIVVPSQRQATPVCDTEHGRCLVASGSLLGSVPWSEKTPAALKAGGLAGRMFKRVWGGKSSSDLATDTAQV